MSWEFDQRVLARLMEPMPTGLRRVTQILKEHLAHGTTIGALLVENGSHAIAFSDGKVSRLNEPVHLEYRKIVQLDDHTVMLLAGSASFAVKFARDLRNWIGYRQDTTNVPMTARAKDSAMQDMLRANIGLANAGMIVAPIIVTYDSAKKKVVLFNFGPDGTMLPHSNYTTSGSGERVKHVLDERWRPGLSVEEGIALARQLVAEVAPRIDCFSGGKPSLVIVGSDGVTRVKE